MADTPSSLVDLRLESIKAAQERTRTAFLGATIASAVICLIAFNSTLSFGRFLPDPPEKSEASWKEEIYKENLKAYYSRRTYTIPALGVTLSVDDIALIGPAALLIFSFYYVAASRSVKSQISDLVNHLPDETTDRQRVYVSLHSQMVLNALNLPEEQPQTTRIGRLWYYITSDLLFRVLAFLPPFAGFFAVLADVTEVFKDSPSNLGTSIFLTQSPVEQIRMVIFWLAGLLLTLLSLQFSIAIGRNNRDVRKLVLRVGELSRLTK